MSGFRKKTVAVLLACVPGVAQSWSGYLVDSKCYAAMERNHNPQSTLMDVNTDKDSEVRYCRPTPKTASFSVVERDGQSFDLDPAGNAKAAPLARNRILYVTVTGEMHKHTVKVESISAAK